MHTARDTLDDDDGDDGECTLQQTEIRLGSASIHATPSLVWFVLADDHRREASHCFQMKFRSGCGLLSLCFIMYISTMGGRGQGKKRLHSVLKRSPTRSPAPSIQQEILTTAYPSQGMHRSRSQSAPPSVQFSIYLPFSCA